MQARLTHLFSFRRMNYPEENYTKDVTPECFFRGSTTLTTTLCHVEWVGGPGRISPVVSTVELPLKASGMTDFG